jgi:hypothetical protein
MKRFGLGISLLMACLGLGASPAWPQMLPGATVEERAINGAKEYI